MAGQEDTRTFRLIRQSPVDYVPRRVVSLVPSLTESLFDLNLGDRLIAVTNYCVRPTEKVKFLQKVGGTKTPDIEHIISLQPDLVLLNDRENRSEDADALRAAGLSLWISGPRTVFDTLNLLWDIMNVFDHAVMIPRIREIERAYDYASAAAQMSESVRVFVPFSRDPWATFDAATYANDVLRVCGGQNVFADRVRDSSCLAGREEHVLCVTAEDVVSAQPDVVLLPDEAETSADEIMTLDIPAAHRGRIYPIDGSLLTWSGTRVAYALRDLPPLLADNE